MVASKEIVVLGAGLSGSLMCVYLARRGYRVRCFEKRPDMRKTSISAGRSINLALSLRGIHPLEKVGLAERAVDQAIAMYGRRIHPAQGEVFDQAYSPRQGEHIYSISRGYLNSILLDEAERLGVVFHFGQEVIHHDLRSRELHFRTCEDGQNRVASALQVVDCEGAGSASRASFIRTPKVNYQQDYLSHSYKELAIAPGPDGSFQIEPNALHIWPRQSFMLIALPNVDRSFTCTLFLSDQAFADLTTKARVQQFFEDHFPDATQYLGDYTSMFFENPTGNLATVKLDPWYYEDHLVFVGDAAHAVVPFYGQGMNCSFEDCAGLDYFLGEYPGDFQAAFAAYSENRKSDGWAIANLALYNYLEMRDLVGDPRFQFQKKLEAEIERRYPGDYFSLYSLVTFKRTPYRLAEKLRELQKPFLESLTEEASSLDQVDWDKVENFVETTTKPMLTGSHELPY